MIHPADAFALTAPLQEAWREIKAEYDGIRGQGTDWHERELYGDGWSVFGLFGFPDGAPILGNILACPLTASLVVRHAPDHGAAGFSILQPGTRISPHRGFQGRYLRAHLGLSVPTGDCGLRVEGRSARWQEGQVLVFDDRVEHEAWNLTDEERVVLLVDFVPPSPADYQ